ncbi:MAG: YndJ family transporter [Saprospiraceae bacterium]|nr:YndJ family transporter [Saprospiraceae bacterium]
MKTTIFLRFGIGGLIAWASLLLLSLILPETQLSWPAVLLTFGILVLIPSALLKLDLLPQKTRFPIIIGVLLASLAFLSPSSGMCSMLCLPYLLGLGFILFLRLRENRVLFSLTNLALLYLLIAGMWLFAERAGFRPLGFDPLINLLTAIHFHFAGFLLTGLAALYTRNFPSHSDIYFNLALLGGAPLVATGITITHFHGPFFVESVAACWMALTGIWVALKIIKTPPHWLGLIGASFLLFGMFLAIYPNESGLSFLSFSFYVLLR